MGKAGKAGPVATQAGLWDHQLTGEVTSPVTFLLYFPAFGSERCRCFHFFAGRGAFVEEMGTRRAMNDESNHASDRGASIT